MLKSLHEGIGISTGAGEAAEKRREPETRFATIPEKLFILATPRVSLDKLASRRLQFARLLIQTLPLEFIITRSISTRESPHNSLFSIGQSTKTKRAGRYFGCTKRPIIRAIKITKCGK